MAAKPKEVETLEKGDLYYFYRPKIEEYDPDEPGDIQQLYVVLHPESSKTRYRLLIIGRQQLPDIEGRRRERQWGFVDIVTQDTRKIRKAFSEETYETKTRGTRTRPAARPCGEGVYRIVRHNDHTHLAYALELPRKRGDVQEQLNIEDEASYIVSIKNPEKPSPRGAGLASKRQADFPKTLQEKFRGRRFADLDPPDFLDHEGAEFVLIGATEDIRNELGIELEAEDESRHSADVFRQMGIDKSEHPVEPLFAGHWT